MEEIRHAAISGGQKPDTADTDDQDTEQDYVGLTKMNKLTQAVPQKS